jgi:outer membrane protein OmpA-like peptidoglycan-associated protein
MRNIVLTVAGIVGSASLLMLAGCSDVETGGPVAKAPTPMLASTPKADQPRKTAMVAAGIAPVEVSGAAGYMEQESGDLRRQLSAQGVIVVRHGTMVIVTLPSDVAFAKGGADVEPKFVSGFDALSGVLNQYPATYIDIVGYADASGTKASNQALSEKRANATAGYLVDHRVKSERIYVAGRGENDPVASNDTPEGRARNRRVEITLRPMLDR